MPTYDHGISGLVGTIAVTILDAAASVHVARTTAGVTEPVAGSGVYHVSEHDADATLTYVWDDGAGNICASETLYAGRGVIPGSAANLATVDGVVDAIKAKTDAIGALAVTITSPVAASGTITVYAGDDYDSGDSRAITASVAVADVPSLTGATVLLKCAQATWTATSCTSDGSNWTITFEPAAAETAALKGRQSYELEATLASGHVVTLATGTLVAVADIPAIP